MSEREKGEHGATRPGGCEAFAPHGEADSVQRSQHSSAETDGLVPSVVQRGELLESRGNEACGFVANLHRLFEVEVFTFTSTSYPRLSPTTDLIYQLRQQENF